jgi:hypothetical protein
MRGQYGLGGFPPDAKFDASADGKMKGMTEMERQEAKVMGDEGADHRMVSFKYAFRDLGT